MNHRMRISEDQERRKFTDLCGKEMRLKQIARINQNLREDVSHVMRVEEIKSEE